MQVEIWSDVVCPWCYIGKRRFEQALARFAHADEVTVTYRSFELDPAAPAHREGTHEEHLARKYGMTVEQARGLNDQMTQTAAAEGLDFHFERIRGGNTFDAHRLLHHATTVGKQLELKERLLLATFTEGEPIADRDTLARVAKEVGIDDADQVLASDRYSDAVRADEQQAAAYGISGVPFFVVDGKYGVSGAQPADLLLQVLDRAYDDNRPLTLVEPTAGSNDAVCDDDSCAV
ncbi:MAG TPA: DsbA family oxidoreductase [Mycobacteriales bacterium]|nr:DsbA family oxidoreductase [Mycobacteriales bacterium]